MGGGGYHCRWGASPGGRAPQHTAHGKGPLLVETAALVPSPCSAVAGVICEELELPAHPTPCHWVGVLPGSGVSSTPAPAREATGTVGSIPGEGGDRAATVIGPIM